MIGGLPQPQGLYDPRFEHDSCGVGFLCHIKGKASHKIVDDALLMLENMDHRGACGCEANTGDGAGILTAIPDELMRSEAKRLFGAELPPRGQYEISQLFPPRDEEEREVCKKNLRKYGEGQGHRVSG